MQDHLVYWIWLQRAVGAGSAEVPCLLEAFKTAKAVWGADRFALERAGITNGKTLDMLCEKSLSGAQKQQERCTKMGWMLTPQDALYPESLKSIFSPPLVLYGNGRLPSFEKTATPAIGIVGTRMCTRYGRECAAAFAAGLSAAGCPIVSGGAKGIDRAAHEGALYAGGHTVIVQACGLNVEYPFANRDLRRQVLESGGAILTEFAPATRAFSGNFHIRNRLISGLSKGVCVVEAPSASGALITARTAREQGRDVFVLPGRAPDKESRGSHTLIREGAILVDTPVQIIEEYSSYFGKKQETEAKQGFDAYYEWLESGGRTAERVADSPIELPGVEPEKGGTPAECPSYASEEVRRVYDALRTHGPLMTEAICEHCGLTPAEVFSVLTELELYGCIENCAGKRYTIKTI